MKYICVNCNHIFESDDPKVRCPSCMRKNSILTYEEHRKSKVSSNKKKILSAAITVTVLLAATGGIFLKFHSSEHKYPYAPVTWKKLSQLSSGFKECSETECYPFYAKENLKKIADQAGNSVKEITDYVKQHVDFTENGTIPSQIYSPEKIALKLLKKQKINLTTLESVLFLQAVLIRNGFTAGIAETDDKKGEYPIEQGKYIIVLPDKNKIIDNFAIKDLKSCKSKYSLLKPEIITARFIALKALSLLLGNINKNDLIIFPEISNQTEQNAKLKTALKYANIAMNADPSPVTAAGTFFIYYISNITLKLKDASSIARNSESPERHALAAIMLYKSGDPKTALFELNKYENQTYLPFKAALKSLIKDAGISNQVLDELSKSNCLSGKTIYFSILQKRKATAEQLNKIANEILNMSKNLKTPYFMVFDYYIKSNQLKKARSLIPKLASFTKNPKDTQKSLENMLNKKQKETTKNQTNPKINDPGKSKKKH